MLGMRNVLFLFLLISVASAAGDTLLNGTSIYLATGDSYGLYQGYVLSIKSVNGDSVWLQLTEDDNTVKSEIVAVKGYFIYNKTNRTILSLKVDNIYSGSSEQNLVSLFPVYQYTDPGKPLPNVTKAIPKETQNPFNGSSSISISTPREPAIWTLGIIFVLLLFYIVRKYW